MIYFSSLDKEEELKFFFGVFLLRCMPITTFLELYGELGRVPHSNQFCVIHKYGYKERLSGYMTKSILNMFRKRYSSLGSLF